MLILTKTKLSLRVGLIQLTFHPEDFWSIIFAMKPDYNLRTKVDNWSIYGKELVNLTCVGIFVQQMQDLSLESPQQYPVG